MTPERLAEFEEQSHGSSDGMVRELIAEIRRLQEELMAND